MNVLPFVMAMLMLLIALTYSRWQNFLTHSAMTYNFSEYIEKRERTNYNEAAEKKYDSIIVQENSPESSEAIKASSKLNIKVLTQPDLREKDPKRYEVYAQLFKQLVQNLYAKHHFFTQAQEERPQCLDELLQAISSSKVNQIAQLDKLELEDPFLNNFLYKLLKDPHLKDYITFYHADNIRVFLAPKRLLEAIFNDPTAVQEIMQQRVHLYTQIKNKNNMEEASTQFTTFVSQFPTPATPFLNTQVSKTDPRRY